MRKLSLIYGKLRKERSASVDSFGCEPSYQRRWESEKELKQIRADGSEDELPDSPVFQRKTECMSEKLRRPAYSEGSGEGLPSMPLMPGPSGVFIGADERIPTLKNTPWKTLSRWSSDSEEEFASPSFRRKKLVLKPKSKTNSPAITRRPQHLTIERLKSGSNRPPMQRTLSAPGGFPQSSAS